MKIRKMILLVILLIAIDQIIKLIINAFFIETTFVFIPSLVEFTPVFNGKHSYINVLLNQYFDMDLGLWIHVISFLIFQAFILFLYDFARYNLSISTKLLDYAMVLQLSAMICALIGNLLWEKGTLDYIYLKPLFIFDLKDLYNTCFIVLFLLTLLIYRKQLNSIKISTFLIHATNRFQKKDL